MRGGKGFYQTQTHAKPSTPSLPLGPLLKSFSLDDLSGSHHDKDGQVQITNCQVVASYNWMEKSKPTMVMPGTPHHH